MSTNPLQAVLEFDGEERYDFFLSQVAEEREVWILVNADNQCLKIAAEDGAIEYLPVWPSAEFASDYAQDSPELSPKAIPLPDFFRKWVSGLTRDGLEVGVFPGLDDTLWITEPEELKRDLQKAMQSF